MKPNFINTDEYPEADRQYKDRLFRFVFQKPEDLLSLYNAVNGTDYKDPDALEINTLGNVLYLSMKNDISFLVSGTLNLYEHQSTCNPNMPMRGLFYFSRLYEKYIAVQDINIYSSAAKTFPFPRHVVFYNGTKDILTEQKSEVIQMVLETFDQEKYEKAMHQEGYDDGYSDGRKDGYSDGKKDGYSDGKADLFLELVRKKLAKGRSLEEIARELETDLETIQKLTGQI